LRPRAY